jgi:glycosyltransferase involved in cell wall biosynthesis
VKGVARVLIIAYTDYFHDGRVKRNAEALSERGDSVDVLCLASDMRGESNGVNVIGLEMPRYRGSSKTAYLGSYLRFFSMASARALKLSHPLRYDLVIVCTMPDAAVLCAIGPKLYGAKVMLDVHDTMPELYRDKFAGRLGAVAARLLMAEERASAWMADRVLAVHDLHRARLMQAGVPGEKIKVVMNLPDPRIFTPSARAGNNGNGAGGEFVLVCHGTVTYRLGLDLAIRALGALRDRIPQARLEVIGGGDYLDEVRHLTATLGLERRVSFARFVPFEKLPEALSHAAVGIVPNRASSATHLMLPVKLLEYATLGIPVIAARLRTIEHYFGPSAVRYFEPGDVERLADAIEDLYRHPEKRERLALDAGEIIAARLTWNEQRKNYYEAIDSLLPGKAIPNGHSPGARA